MSSSERQVSRFCHQYLQLEHSLDLPESSLLKTSEVQDALYARLFADGAVRFSPPQRYQLRILKDLMARVEASIDDWDEFVSKLTKMASIVCSNCVRAFLMISCLRSQHCSQHQSHLKLLRSSKSVMSPTIFLTSPMLGLL